MKANLGLAIFKVPAAVRAAVVLLSLAALAMGSGAPDDWGYGGWSCWKW